MRWYLIVCWMTIILSFPSLAFVEEQPAGWKSTRQCLGNLPTTRLPQAQWNFDGVIFSQDENGVYALRRGANPYLVAPHSDKLFSELGDFSPDGQWFAYPVGSTVQAGNSLSSKLITVNQIRVVSTTPKQDSYQIQWRGQAIGSAPITTFHRVKWLDKSRFVFLADFSETVGVIHAFENVIEPWKSNIDLERLFDFSPDGRYAFYSDDHAPYPLMLYDWVNQEGIRLAAGIKPGIWLPDASGFFASRDTEYRSAFKWSLALIDIKGQQTDIVGVNSVISSLTVSPDGNQLAFIADDKLYIAHLGIHQITDFCLQVNQRQIDPQGSEIAWSPDSHYIIFAYSGYPLLINIETQAMENLDYESGIIRGWYNN